MNSAVLEFKEEDFFICERFRCRMLKVRCAERRRRACTQATGGIPVDTPDFEPCIDCAQGDAVCEELGMEVHVPRERGCKVEGCDEKHYGRGFCRRHYALWQKGGLEDCDADPLHGRRRPARGSVVPRTKKRGGVMTQTEKTCERCREKKPLEDFPRQYRSRDGHMHVCRACIAKGRKGAPAKNGGAAKSGPPQHKRCSSCGEEKPLDAFHRDARGKFGRKSVCKKCVSRLHRGRSRAKRGGIRQAQTRPDPSPAPVRKTAPDGHDALRCAVCGRSLDWYDDEQEVGFVAEHYLLPAGKVCIVCFGRLWGAYGFETAVCVDVRPVEYQALYYTKRGLKEDGYAND